MSQFNGNGEDAPSKHKQHLELNGAERLRACENLSVSFRGQKHQNSEHWQVVALSEVRLWRISHR